MPDRCDGAAIMLNRLSLAFFTVSALCGLAGMIFGLIMGISQDFSLSPSHAHLNLLGWASLSLMGLFYAVSRRAGVAGWIQFALSATGGVLMPISLGLYLSGQKAWTAGVSVGSIAAVLGMILFVFVVLANWRRPAVA